MYEGTYPVHKIEFISPIPKHLPHFPPSSFLLAFPDFLYLLKIQITMMMNLRHLYNHPNTILIIYLLYIKNLILNVTGFFK